jgi:DNA-binding CsgD family transcriptional regulator
MVSLSGWEKLGRLVGSAGQQFTVEIVVAGVRKTATFTARQVEILCLLVRGLSPQQASRQLGISRRTAEHHLEEARRRAEAATTAELLAKVVEAGLAPEQRSARSASAEGANICVMTTFSNRPSAGGRGQPASTVT